jgi:preprotein translocase subunit SecE
MSTTQVQKAKMTSETPERIDKPERERSEWMQELLAYPTRLKRFLTDVRSEMKLVVWPSRSEVVNTTMVVIMTTILFAFFLWIVDKGSERVVSMILKQFTH